jgi:branched-chain amino acid transport system ATP-binding protein
MEPLLELRGLRKRFGGLEAARGVDLKVEPGEIRCLIGPNGAGKSTLFRLILGIFPGLSAEQNLVIALQRRVAPADLPRETDRLLELIDLTPSRDVPAGELAHGQKQWLEIGMAIAQSPRLLLLDEPTAGMSPEETRMTGELVKRLNAQGMTVVVIEHDMAFVRQIASKVTVLHFGQVFDEGSLDDIIRSDDVARIYLGEA